MMHKHNVIITWDWYYVLESSVSVAEYYDGEKERKKCINLNCSRNNFICVSLFGYPS